MRCDGWGRVIFRPLREIFREKIRSAVRAFARVFPHETARVHRGDTAERSGGSAPLLRAVSASIEEKRRREQGARRARNRPPRPLIRERPLASLMTRRRVLA